MLQIKPLHTIDSIHINRHVFSGSEQNRSVIANVQSDDLWPSRMHAATHILQEKTHACGVLKKTISGFMFP